MSFRCLCPVALGGALFGALFVTSALADDSVERAKLTGTWQAQGGSAASAVWILDTQGDVIRVSSAQGGKKIAEFVCDPGKECEMKDGGHKVKVTMYFNGPKLVVMETRGDEIVKRRFTAGEQADTLDLEVMPMVPSGKTETIHCQRSHDVAASVAK